MHFNSKYPDFTTAAKYYDGLAVLGFFYTPRIRNDFRNHLPFSNIIPHIQEFNATYTDYVNRFSYRQLIRRKNIHVASYHGSLTLPSCEESVTWMVAPNPISVNQKELDLLQLIKDCDGNRISRNNRPIQADNGRIPTIFSARLGSSIFSF